MGTVSYWWLHSQSDQQHREQNLNLEVRPVSWSPWGTTRHPSVHSFSSMEPTPLSQAPAKKEKRRSYLEAVSENSLNVLENAPPRQSKSADPLWLPSSKPVQI